MICNFSTLMQFIAAIYVTLSFDNVLFRGLWSFNYVDRINDKISSLKIGTKSIEEDLKNEIETRAKSIEKHSRIRGFFCLFFCVFSLWYSGVEQQQISNISSNEAICNFHAPFAFYTLLCIVAYIFISMKISRLSGAFLSCLILLISYFFLKHIDYSCLLRNNLIFYYVKNISILCSVLVVIPLFYQLVINWLYSGNYYFILGDKLYSEFSKYQSALNCKDNSDIPDGYNDAFSQAYFDSKNNNNEDTSVTNITDIFRANLDNVVKLPSFGELLKYSCIHIFQEKEDKLSQIEFPKVKGDEIPQQNSEIIRTKEEESNASQPINSKVDSSRKEKVGNNRQMNLKRVRNNRNDRL